MGKLDEAPIVDVPDAAAWRSWLADNHDGAGGVWLVIQRKGSPDPGPTYEEAVEEALCFGWIDSIVRAGDATSFRQYFAPRKRGGIWAASNKARVERLVAQGRMTPAGLAVIDAAKADGSWDTLTDVDALVEPDDLRAALDAVPVARAVFEAMPPSERKIALYWIASAKRPATRAERIRRTVIETAAGGRPSAWRS